MGSIDVQETGVVEERLDLALSLVHDKVGFGKLSPEHAALVAALVQAYTAQVGNERLAEIASALGEIKATLAEIRNSIDRRE